MTSKRFNIGQVWLRSSVNLTKISLPKVSPMSVNC